MAKRAAMRQRTFVARRQPDWERLEALVDRAARRGVRALAPEELTELALRFRAATSDLAAAQSRAYAPEVTAYLNRLTARAYAIVHAGVAPAGWAQIVEFFARTFPREVRRAWRPIAATTAVFAIAATVSYAAVANHPANAYAFLSGGQLPVIDKSLHDSNFGFDRARSPLMSSEIITNNIKVTMVAFAGGMTLGIVTLWAILTNGLMLGTLGALFASHGYGSDFWATIAPHGVIELTSIQIAGAAGIALAQAVVAPGRLRRIDALKASARRAGVLMIGVAALLVVAGTIEGFVTPQRTPEWFRLGFGAVTAVLLFGYFGLAGRGHHRETTARAPAV